MTKEDIRKRLADGHDALVTALGNWARSLLHPPTRFELDEIATCIEQRVSLALADAPATGKVLTVLEDTLAVVALFNVPLSFTEADMDAVQKQDTRGLSFALQGKLPEVVGLGTPEITAWLEAKYAALEA